MPDPLLLALIGDLFEVAVKRGVLAFLLHSQLLSPEHPALAPFLKLRVSDLHEHLSQQLDALDDNLLSRIRTFCDHLLLSGYGLGWTCLREYLRRRPGTRAQPLALEALYCPLSLRDRAHGTFDAEEDEAQTLAAFWSAFSLPAPADQACLDKGAPARADFLLLLRARPDEVDLLCLEFSLNVPAALSDFTSESDQLDELERYVRLVEGRGVFSRISAEVSGERFALSQGLISHLGAFTSRDKPLYKLCQGCSYLTRLVPLLRQRGSVAKPVRAQVLAITAAGLEGVSGAFLPSGDDPGACLMNTLGHAYRRAPHPREGDDDAFQRELRAVFTHLLRSLPAVLRQGLGPLLQDPPVGGPLQARLSEPVADFLNPNQPVPLAQGLAWLGEEAPVAAFLRAPPREVIAATLRSLGHQGQEPLTLRALHEAAVVAGLRAIPSGKLHALGLEGHPGIGKTTAVIRHLNRHEGGFLFTYISPRVVINADVTDKLASKEGQPSGVLTLTSNSILIGGARRWYEAQAAERGAPPRQVDSAVVAEGVAGLRRPGGNILFLTAEEARDVDENHGGGVLRKTEVDERTSLIEDVRSPGVLRTLATAARAALRENEAVQRLVLTAAIQGYRERGDAGSTVKALGNLFHSAPDTPRGVAERAALARRVPLILFMVDELAGDGAGTPLVHALAAWLHQHFIDPFCDEPGGSPFTVILLIADASLGNEVVLHRFLEHPAAPDKVLVSESGGPRPFRLAAGPLRLGGRVTPTLHVMADSFPAAALTIDYSVRLMPLTRPRAPVGEALSPRQIVREQAGELLLQSAFDEILRAAQDTEDQIIFFNQDKRFLGELQQRLRQSEELRALSIGPDDIVQIHSSIHPAERRRLVQPETRDRKRVFLMTSSGARGVSFPRATHIIAFVPRFSIESGLMEIAQLVYRGRGSFRDPRTGAERSGDALERRLVMVINDFYLPESEREEASAPDPRRWVRQATDLISLLVLLRATLFTRIRGDAAVPGQRLAVVPVGRVGVDDMGQTMSQHVRDFLKEADVFLAGEDDRERAPLIVLARDRVAALFEALSWVGRGTAPGRRSLTDEDTLVRLSRQITAAPLPLLRPTALPLLPETTYAIGPLWLEDWRDLRTEESFTFEVWDPKVESSYRRLVGQLREIEQDRALPAALRRPARALHGILVREREAQKRQHDAQKLVGKRAVWVALPIDYPRFCASAETPEPEPRARRTLDDPASWLHALERALGSAASATLPILPRFTSKPFLALVALGDPTDLERALDPRYFMASTELNLLNTLLFAAPER